jgi:hypothetical protein
LEDIFRKYAITDNPRSDSVQESPKKSSQSKMNLDIYMQTSPKSKAESPNKFLRVPLSPKSGGGN